MDLEIDLYNIFKNLMVVQKVSFFENSFLSELTPYKLPFYAMSGREGLTDTAVKNNWNWI